MSFSGLFKTREQLALAELARRQKMAGYRERPDLWLSERFGEPINNLLWSNYPEYAGHEWDGTKDPFYKAAMALAKGRNVGIESATSTGKTFNVARLIYWFLDCFENSLVVTTAPKLDQLKTIMWTEIGNAYTKFKRIRPNSDFMSLNIVVDKRLRKVAKLTTDEQAMGMGWQAIGIVSGVAAGEDSATKMQGFHREHMLFVLDEMAGIHPAVLTAIVNTCTAANNVIIGVGNPDSQIDTLHAFCQMAKTEHIIISAYDHPNIVCKRTIVPGAVSIDSVEDRKKEYGEDSNFYKSRVRGIAPEQGANALIRTEFLDQCFIPGDKYIGIEIDMGSANAAGIDVANSDDGDMACVALGKRNELTYIHEFQCPNANHLAYNLMWDDYKLVKKEFNVFKLPKLSDFKIQPDNIGVDGVGVGAGTVNAFHDEGIKVISLVGGQVDTAIKAGVDGEVLYKFNSLRSQMFFEAREDLRAGLVRINIPKRTFGKLKKELIMHDYKVQGGKIVVESKEDIKKKLGGKSPNLADAFVYWNWMRKGYYHAKVQLPFSTGKIKQE